MFLGAVVTHVQSCSPELQENIEKNLRKHFTSLFCVAIDDLERIYIATTTTSTSSTENATTGACHVLTSDACAIDREEVKKSLRELSVKLDVTVDFGEGFHDCLDDLTLVSNDVTSS